MKPTPIKPIPAKLRGIEKVFWAHLDAQIATDYQRMAIKTAKNITKYNKMIKGDQK